jgi:DNA-binding transcriptional regulator LsrR (DeoR family)
MPPSPHTVFLEVVDRYRDSGEPVTRRATADSLGVDRASLSRPLDSLCEVELLEVTEHGYRPTVTAEELLALDVDLDEVLVVDPVDE